MTIRIGIIGFGMASQTFHLPLIQHCPDFTLAGIASSKTTLPDNIPRFLTPESLIHDPNVDAIAIITPNDTHYPLAKAALIAGKHVVLEKPMCITTAQANDLVHTAKTANRQLAIFHNRRLDNDFLTVQRLIADGTLGPIRRVISNWDRFRPIVRDRWRENAGEGSGIWYDLGPHLIDQALVLFGMPYSLTANLRALRPNSPSVDHAQVTLHYPDKTVILGTSPYCAAPNLRFQIDGEQGSFVKYYLDPQEQQLKAGHIHSPIFGTEPSEHYGTLYDAAGNATIIPTVRGRMTDFYPNFAAAIRGEAKLLVAAEEAVKVMQLIEAAIASQEKNISILL